MRNTEQTRRERRYQRLRKRLKPLGPTIPARQRSRIAYRLSLLDCGLTDHQLRTYAIIETMADKAERELSLRKRVEVLVNVEAPSAAEGTNLTGDLL